jgi:hypothetical protein
MMCRMPDAPPPPAGPESPEPAALPVQHCPFCGESIGAFWGRRGDDGSHWCESCQCFFRVEVD